MLLGEKMRFPSRLWKLRYRSKANWLVLRARAETSASGPLVPAC
jgi:hypothetical protein